MKSKYLIILTLISLLSFNLEAQSLKVVDTNPVQQGFIGEEIRTTLFIQNISEEPIYYRVVQLNKQIGSSQQSLICVNNDCFTDNIARSEERSSGLVRKINPGETDDAISVVLEAGLVDAVSSVLYSIENIKDPSDRVELEFQYEVTEAVENGLLYSSKNVDLRDVYPNPVTETAFFDYNIKNDSKEAKIIIHNVLGTVAGEFQLNPFEEQLKVSVEKFNPGVYFYSLYIDNEGVATKKLVVRK